MTRERLAHLTLRVGAAFAFLYPPIAAIGDPDSWIGYFPAFMRTLGIADSVLLHSFGVLEVLLALWLLSGWKIRIPAALATLMLFVIVGLNATQFPVVFRDLSIAAMTVALVVWPSARTSISSEQSPVS